MATPASGVRPEHNFFRTLGEDAQQLWNEIRRHGLKRSIERSFLELQNFYLDDHARQRLLGMRRVQRAAHLAAWLVKSLFYKLTPTRRVLLVLSVILMWSATSYESHGRTTNISVHFPFLGIVTLLLILMLELKDKLLARDELEAGRTVQKALMPSSNPSIPGWDIWLFTRSANDVGGDLVDYIPVDGRRTGIVLGDVAGKGLPAALLMAKLQSTLRALAVDEISLEKLGERTNRILCRDGLPNRFATMVYVDVAASSGSVRVLNCGHLPPLVLRGPNLEEMPLGAMALGMLPDARFSEQAIELSHGDVLVVFSDGLTEAMNGHDEFFGDDRLRARLPALANLAAQDIGAQVVATVDEFVGDAAPHDDLSLIVLRRAS